MLRNHTINIILLMCSLILIFLAIESFYRIFDPFPYFGENEINKTEHGNLLEYDPLVGWRGIPKNQTYYITQNAKIAVKHNQYGFRDIEPPSPKSPKPGIVFLGDSFTWGYEVEFEDMYINLLRKALPYFDIYNISHRGFGTDQELIVFKHLNFLHKIKLVVLAFCENDIEDNNSNFRYKKNKPQYKYVDGNLVLSGTPVMKQIEWADTSSTDINVSHVKVILKKFLFNSHFLHDLYFRYKNIRYPYQKKSSVNKTSASLVITHKILNELKSTVEKKGAKLLIVLIPSKSEIEKIDHYIPYQNDIIKICSDLNIQHLDLAPYFEKKLWRTYYRIGMHWNARGHQVAAKAIMDRLNTIDEFRKFNSALSR